MKTRTLFIPAAFAGTAVFATVPTAAQATVAKPIVSSSNALVEELETVVGVANGPDAVLANRVIAMTAGVVNRPPTSQTCRGASLAAKNAKLYKAQRSKSCPTSSGPAKLQRANGTKLDTKPMTTHG